MNAWDFSVLRDVTKHIRSAATDDDCTAMAVDAVKHAAVFLACEVQLQGDLAIGTKRDYACALRAAADILEQSATSGGVPYVDGGHATVFPSGFVTQDRLISKLQAVLSSIELLTLQSVQDNHQNSEIVLGRLNESAGELAKIIVALVRPAPEWKEGVRIAMPQGS